MNRHLPLLFTLTFPIFLYSQVLSGAGTDVWIDVRSPMENMTSSISGHVNVPHERIAAMISELAPDKSSPVYLYCSTGRRAGLAKETLEGLGYSNVTNVGGLSDARKLYAASQ